MSWNCRNEGDVYEKSIWAEQIKIITFYVAKARMGVTDAELKTNPAC